jgi:hypothetical protein
MLAATYRNRVEQLVCQEMILLGLGYDVLPCVVNVDGRDILRVEGLGINR